MCNDPTLKIDWEFENMEFQPKVSISRKRIKSTRDRTDRQRTFGSRCYEEHFGDKLDVVCRGNYEPIRVKSQGKSHNDRPISHAGA